MPNRTSSWFKASYIYFGLNRPKLELNTPTSMKLASLKKSDSCRTKLKTNRIEILAILFMKKEHRSNLYCTTNTLLYVLTIQFIQLM